MSKLVCVILLVPSFILGASSGEEYDIVPRTINFIIFFAILFYLLADPLRNYYKSRILKISSKLDEIQRKLLESKNKKLNIVRKLEEARINASNALTTAKKEAEILANKIRTETKEELALFDKHFEEYKDYELRRMEREVVSEVLVEIFNDPQIRLKQSEILDIMMKKVS